MPPQPLRNVNWHAMEAEATDNMKKFGQLVVRAWLDPAFEAQFKANPEQTMLNAGMKLLPDQHIDPATFQLPQKPANVDAETFGITEGEAMNISCFGSASSFSCPGSTASTFGSGFC